MWLFVVFACICTIFVLAFVLYKSKKLATIVEGNPKVPFSIATTPMCREGRYFFPGLLYFTLDPYLIVLSAKQGGIKYHFLSLWYDSTWYCTQVSRAIGEHSNPRPCTKIYKGHSCNLNLSYKCVAILFKKFTLLKTLMIITTTRCPSYSMMIPSLFFLLLFSFLMFITNCLRG